jgi:hypothetical protein
MIKLLKETRNLYDYEVIHYVDGDNLKGFCPEYDEERVNEDPRKGKGYVYTSLVLNVDESGPFPIAETVNTFYILHEEKYDH